MKYPLVGSYYFIYRPDHYNPSVTRAEMFDGWKAIESVVVGEMSTTEVTEYFKNILNERSIH